MKNLKATIVCILMCSLLVGCSTQKVSEQENHKDNDTIVSIENKEQTGSSIIEVEESTTAVENMAVEDTAVEENTIAEEQFITLRGMEVAIDADCIYLRSAMQEVSDLTDEEILSISKCKNVKTFVITPGVISKTQLELFNSVVEDALVEVDTEYLTDEDWDWVCNLKNVSKISAGTMATYIDKNTLSGVEKLDKLREINICSKQDSIDISALSNCKNLESVIIKLENNGSIDVSALINCPKLKVISTGFTDMVGYEQFSEDVNLMAENVYKAKAEVKATE